MKPSRPPPRGYTLFEVLIVLVTLSALAAVALPRLENLGKGADDVRLASELSLIRDAIEHYKVTHEGIHPDHDPAAQLTGRTDPFGTLLPQEQTDGIGPFLRRPFPENPVNHLSTIHVVDRLPREADGTSGWIYVRSSGVLRANLPGSASNGLDYLSL